MIDDFNNFKSWFIEILEKLYPIREAGLAILLITFPLIERYLRHKAKLPSGAKLTKPFYEEFLRLIPELKTWQDAKKFWHIYRNGLLHTLTFYPDGGATHDISDILIKSGKDYWVHPEIFSRRIIEKIESDFKTFWKDSIGESSLPKIVPLAPTTPISKIFSTYTGTRGVDDRT